MVARQPTKPASQEVALRAKDEECGKWDGRKEYVSDNLSREEEDEQHGTTESMRDGTMIGQGLLLQEHAN